MSEQVEVDHIPNCDFCNMGIVPRKKPAEFDGKTVHGPWANMCDQHFEQYGLGLGTGRGQRLVLRQRDQAVTVATAAQPQETP